MTGTLMTRFKNTRDVIITFPHRSILENDPERVPVESLPGDDGLGLAGGRAPEPDDSAGFDDHLIRSGRIGRFNPR